MTAEEVLNSLDMLLKGCDTMDQVEICGVKGFTNGKHTSVDLCRQELERFLLYVASGKGYITELENLLLNIVAGDSKTDADLLQIANETDDPEPQESVLFRTALLTDHYISLITETEDTSFFDLLLSGFKILGIVMAEITNDEPAISRCSEYIWEMQDYANEQREKMKGDYHG